MLHLIGERRCRLEAVLQRMMTEFCAPTPFCRNSVTSSVSMYFSISLAASPPSWSHVSRNLSTSRSAPTRPGFSSASALVDFENPIIDEYCLASSACPTPSIPSASARTKASPQVKKELCKNCGTNLALLCNYLPSPLRVVRAADGSITTFDACSIVTVPTSINPSGEITGWCTNATFSAHSFLRDRDGTITRFDVPGSSGTSPTGNQSVRCNHRNLFRRARTALLLAR